MGHWIEWRLENVPARVIKHQRVHVEDREWLLYGIEFLLRFGLLC